MPEATDNRTSPDTTWKPAVSDIRELSHALDRLTTIVQGARGNGESINAKACIDGIDSLSELLDYFSYSAISRAPDQPEKAIDPIERIPVETALDAKRGLSMIEHLPGERDDRPFAKIVLHVREGHEEKDAEELLDSARMLVNRATYSRSPESFRRLATAVDDLEELIEEAAALGEGGDHNTARDAIDIFRAMVVELAGYSLLAQK